MNLRLIGSTRAAKGNHQIDKYYHQAKRVNNHILHIIGCENMKTSR